MSMPQTQTGQSEAQRMEKIRSLSNEIGSCVVMWNAGSRPAQLSAEQLQKLQEREKELGTILLAYECS